MPDQNTPQTFITVKKADGTTERIPFVDFQKKYGSLNIPATTPSANVPQPLVPASSPAPAQSNSIISTPTPIPTPSVSTAPMIEGERHLSTTTPVTDVFVDQAIAEAKDQSAPVAMPQPIVPPAPTRKYVDNSQKPAEQKAKWNEVDHRSLLEEELEVQGAQHSTPNHSSEMAELMNVITGLDFTLPNGLLPRLQSLVASAKKGVRTDSQLLEYFQREASMGGLGLNANQAGSLLSLLQTKYNLPIESGKLGQMRAKKPAADIPSAEAVARLAPLPNKENQPTESNRPPLTSAVPFEARPMVRDVVAPLSTDRPTVRPESTSPIDELKNFSLVDWRRLSTDPATAANRILQKFETIKQDSYLQFLQACAAWRQSPIFGSYQTILAQSLSTGQPVSSLATGADNGLTAGEVAEMVRISESI